MVYQLCTVNKIHIIKTKKKKKIEQKYQKILKTGHLKENSLSVNCETELNQAKYSLYQLNRIIYRHKLT